MRPSFEPIYIESFDDDEEDDLDLVVFLRAK